MKNNIIPNTHIDLPCYYAKTVVLISVSKGGEFKVCVTGKHGDFFPVKWLVKVV